MYSLYLLILCYTSTLLPSVNTYVVLAANLDDFRSLAKKYIPNKNSVDQFKVMVLETGHKNYNRETLEDDEDIDRTVKYVEEEQDDPYDVQKPVFEYQLNKPPRVSLHNPQKPLPKTRHATPKILTLDDVVDKLKHGILQEIIDKSGDDTAQLNTQVNNALARQLIAVVNKNVPNKPKSKVKNPVPIKFFNEEVQLKGTYESTIDKDVQPRIHYLGQVQIPSQYLKKKPVKDASFTKKVVPQKHRFKSPKHFGAGKKVKYHKQLLAPVNSNKGFSVYLPQPNLVQPLMQQSSLGQQLMIQPSLGQQTGIMKQSILEPQLTLMQQPNEMQLPLDQQPNIIQQLAFMQQQINRLNKIAEQNLAKNRPTPSTTLEAPLDVIETPFEIVPNPNSEGDEQETNDSKEDQVSVAEDTASSEETTIEPNTGTSTKATSTTTVENEQFIEENEDEVEDTAGTEEAHTAGTVENDDKTTEETKLEEVTEAHSNDEEEKTTDEVTTPAEAILVKADNTSRLGEVPKIHTQEFGNPAAGEPIVEKTYNFNVPIVEPNKGSVSSKFPFESARKVMLF